ncbi:radical SAM protein [Treponema endosymbiont of Eucomonympha sp.]|uniref:radical SAM protein n=1 Tax=Treponema endosymbiont of Eucomonympha sp. TaxID=1580831 RepID=UPI0007510FBF|nr:radical SAM protein [Treponema endosymbiont of Eucomonympha sp.]
MKHNSSVISTLFAKERALSYKMLRGFVRMWLAKYKPKRDYGYNHMKNLCLVYFKLTPLCNLRCVMCGQRGDKGMLTGQFAAREAKTVVPLARYKEIVDELAPRNPILYLWGGEPFLYPDLLPLAKYMVDKGLFVSVNTNGTLLEKHAEQIVRGKWSSLFISLDAFRETNDSIRGAGSYDCVASGIRAINREKQRQNSVYPFLGIVTTVTNLNYLCLEELAEASREWNLDVHAFNLGTYTNDAIVAAQRACMKEKLHTDIDCLEGYNTGYNEHIDAKKLHAILRNLHRRNFGHVMITVPALNPGKIDRYYSSLETPVRNHCVVPWCQTNVNYNGDVHFCADYPDFILGNIKNQSFAEIYNGDRANLFRKTLHQCEGGMFPGCLRCYQNMLFGNKIRGF